MGFLEKGLLLYVLLAAAMCFWQPVVIFGDANNAANPNGGSVLSFFNIALINGTPTYNNAQSYSFQGDAGMGSGNMTSLLPIPTGTTILGFVDPVFQVFSWVGTFLKIVFSPIVVTYYLVTLGAPSTILFFFGIPITLLFLVAIIMFIRNGLTGI